MSLAPLAAVLLQSTRYGHGRSLHVYEDTIAAAREVWPLVPERDRVNLLALWKEQVPADLERMIELHAGGAVPVTREELEGELAAYRALWAWCERRLGRIETWPCEACGCAPERAAGECRCRCHPDRVRHAPRDPACLDEA